MRESCEGWSARRKRALACGQKSFGGSDVSVVESCERKKYISVV